MDRWWDEFVSALSSGEWAAVLLQGLITGSAAIAVAFWILRRQLAADQKLAKDERVEAQRIVQAEKFAAAGASIGRILIQIALSVRDLSNRDLGALLRSTSKPLDIDLSNTAKVEAAIYFPSFNQHVAVARLRERDVLWVVGRNVLASNAALTDEAIGHALRQALAPAQNDLRTIGNELIRWSGEGNLPDCLAVVKSVEPLPTTLQAKTPARNEWKQKAAVSMEAAAKTKLPRSTEAVPV
ncbi:hypothetical protein C3B59_17190 [Cryobacterium zongtaii]|uniref:Uncharacterized protein n=1 Tax=Cryobacterium zongtaii TaxID=1259217 RepID=A0A2S3Z5Y4_9MICO|nr:hypothetical protein [Cryobacterium zongtaii]POH59630.1 hypothetical protein C3B59_17190 [Cryobacterium zongtaii]